MVDNKQLFRDAMPINSELIKVLVEFLFFIEIFLFKLICTWMSHEDEEEENESAFIKFVCPKGAENLWKN